MTSPTPAPDLSPLKRAFVAIEEMKAKLEAAERRRHEPIAIIGMGCRFPAGANDPDRFWELLRNGASAVEEIPTSRWDIAAFYDPEPDAVGKMYTRWAGLLDEVGQFEPQFFGISPREAIRMDPQQRLVLEVAWEALEAAGQAPDKLQNSSTGVFLGLCTSDYANLQGSSHSAAEQDAYTLSGLAHSIAAGRISYVLGLHGPSVAIDTACSSSLVAVHLACQSLRAEDCRMALAGAVHLILSPENSVSFSRLRMLAFDGRCKTFDASADGFVEGEGCGVVVLKRLSDALADKDRIVGVIRGSAVNHDGPSSGLTAPNGPAQEAVMRTALSRAGLRGGEIDYVEAHGTGTSLGDPIELQALGAVLGEGRAGDRPLLVGSVKTNLGHLQAAAGLAGLVKILLALDREELPPHLHFDTPNPYVPWDRLPLKVLTERVSWRAGLRPRLAGVSAFGFSGTNAHLIIGEAPRVIQVEAERERPLHVLTLSARSAAALLTVAGRWRAHLDAVDDAALPDVCFTANAGRAHLPYRLAIATASRQDAVEQLGSIVDGQPSTRVARGHLASSDRPKIAFLFTGQGSQHPGMGRQLYDTQPTFRAAIDRCDALLRDHLARPLLSVLYPEAADDRTIDETAYTQPALFAIEYALAEMWRSWGVVPGAVLGHSIGEYVAATLAGVFDLEHALTLVAARGRLMQSLPAGGTMAAVMADESTIRPLLAPHRGRVGIAAVNGPGNVVISGAADAVTALVAQLGAAGIAAERLTVSHAFHSVLMDPILDEFERAAAAARPSAAGMLLISNLTGRPVRREVADAGYWRRHLREPVLFAAGIASLYEQGYRTFVEIGPRPTLCAMGQRALAAPDVVWLPSIRAGREDWVQVLDALRELYVRGAAVDWNGFDRDYPRRKRLAPTYPFERARYWIPEEATRPTRLAAPARGGHPLLGPAVRTALGQVVFESTIGIDSLPFLADHQKQGMALFPATAYLEMGIVAAQEALGPGDYIFEDLVITEPLVLGADPVIVQVIVAPGAAETSTCQFFSRVATAHTGAGQWRAHAAGTARPAASDRSAETESLEVLRGRCAAPVSVDDFYSGLLEAGHFWGPAFRGLSALWAGDAEALARIELPGLVRDGAGEYRIHPVLLDSAMQIMGAAVPQALQLAQSQETFLPVSLGRYRIHAAGIAAGWSHVRLRDLDSDGFVADVRLYDDDGRLIAEVVDMYNRRMPAPALRATALTVGELTWRPQPYAAPAGAAENPRGTWLIVGQPGSVAAELVRRLTDQGRHAIMVEPAGRYESIDDEGHISVDPFEAEHFSRLLEELRVVDHHRIEAAVHVSSVGRAAGGAETESVEASVRRECAGLLHLIQALVADDRPAPPRLCLVTCGAVAVADAADDVAVAQTPLWGLMRSAGSESEALRCSSIDLDPNAPEDDVDRLMADILSPDRENQIAFRGGQRHVARLSRVDGASAVPDDQHARPVTLEIGERGTLDRLALMPRARTAPAAGEVEVRVAAAGLNFRDVLNALGMYAGEAGPMGQECVGTVVRVGAGVQHLKIDDEVMGMASSTFSTYVTGSAAGFVVKPANLGAEDAATIPVTFLTAEFGLNRLARMAAGDRVLIHAAAGGVGLAAVQLAQQAGAEIFATAGSPDKHAYLKSLGVRHVMSSRSLDFAEQIRQLTGGAGVDIVLNSLAGEFIDKSLSIVKPGGRFVEIGRAGIWTAAEMAAVRPDVEYFPLLPQDDISVIQPVLAGLAEAFRAGELKPLRRISFPMTSAVDAFRYMAQAKHIGKIVLTLESRSGSADRPAVTPDSTYLITGGLGALGLHVARWMVAAGARHLVLSGRRGPDTQAAEAIGRLEAAGAEVRIDLADVSSAAEIGRLIGKITAEMPPLRGVVHAAGALDDGMLQQQTWPRFDRMLGAKARGAWNLHEHTRTAPLDFFVMFSSMVSMLGGPGQGIYAAANAFLDGLAHHRRHLGLPALTIDWGPWSGDGMAGRVTDRDRGRWTELGYGLIAPEQGVSVLERLLTQAPARPQVAVVDIDWATLLRQFPRGGEPPFLEEFLQRQIARPTPSGPVRRNLVQDIEAIAPSGRRAAVVGFVRGAALKVLGLEAATELDPRLPLRECGLDSLMAVELRNVLAAALERAVPATLLFKHPTIEALAGFVIEASGMSVAAVAPAAALPDADVMAVGALDDDDVRKLLAEELAALSSADWMGPDRGGSA